MFGFQINDRALEDTETMNELVEKLSKGTHPVVATRCNSATQLKEQFDRNFVLLKFTQTTGGTELGCQVDQNQTKLDQADFEQSTGEVSLVGHLMLDYVKVELVATLELATLSGTAQLKVVA